MGPASTRRGPQKRIRVCPRGYGRNYSLRGPPCAVPVVHPAARDQQPPSSPPTAAPIAPPYAATVQKAITNTRLEPYLPDGQGPHRQELRQRRLGRPRTARAVIGKF